MMRSHTDMWVAREPPGSNERSCKVNMRLGREISQSNDWIDVVRAGMDVGMPSLPSGAKKSCSVTCLGMM